MKGESIKKRKQAWNQLGDCPRAWKAAHSLSQKAWRFEEMGVLKSEEIDAVSLFLYEIRKSHRALGTCSEISSTANLTFLFTVHKSPRDVSISSLFLLPLEGGLSTGSVDLALLGVSQGRWSLLVLPKGVLCTAGEPMPCVMRDSDMGLEMVSPVGLMGDEATRSTY
ncbi:hypothetical protein BC567DRAFT_220793 [Phyllosticta citribraziliensis]